MHPLICFMIILIIIIFFNFWHFNLLFSLGIVCPPSYNLSEFLVSQLAINNDPEALQRVNKICNQFSSSEQGQMLSKKLETELTKNLPCCYTENHIFKVSLLKKHETYLNYFKFFKIPYCGLGQLRCLENQWKTTG